MRPRTDTRAPASGRRASLLASLRVVALAASLALASDALALQDGPRGPFEAARLSDEPLTEDPAGAFEVVLLSAGVFLLGGLATAAFLALSKLGALERALLAEGAKQRQALEALRADLASAAEAARVAREEDGDDGDEQASRDVARLEAAVDRLGAALEQQAAGFERLRAESAASSDGGPEESPSGLESMRDDLRAFAEAARAASESASRGTTDAIRSGLADLRDALAAGGGSAAPEAREAVGPAGLVERVQTRLLAMGYQNPGVVSAPDEIATAIEAGGDVVVEARRSGATHKGRITLEGGAISAVHLRPGHDVFP